MTVHTALPRRCLHRVHPAPAFPLRALLFFASALPAQGASQLLFERTGSYTFASALPAQGASHAASRFTSFCLPLPRRCLHRVHRRTCRRGPARRTSLPRRCLHRVHPVHLHPSSPPYPFASALPAQGASSKCGGMLPHKGFASALPAQGASRHTARPIIVLNTLPRRCLHRVHPNSASGLSAARPLPRRCLHRVHHRALIEAAVKEIFASALPAQGASVHLHPSSPPYHFASALPAQGASRHARGNRRTCSLPRRCLHRVHRKAGHVLLRYRSLPRRCLHRVHRVPCPVDEARLSLPRRCLHRVHHGTSDLTIANGHFASALPAQGASTVNDSDLNAWKLCLGAACTGCILGDISLGNASKLLCLGAACTGCIGKSRQIAAHHFVAYAVSR